MPTDDKLDLEADLEAIYIENVKANANAGDKDIPYFVPYHDDPTTEHPLPEPTDLLGYFLNRAKYVIRVAAILLLLGILCIVIALAFSRHTKTPGVLRTRNYEPSVLDGYSNLEAELEWEIPCREEI